MPDELTPVTRLEGFLTGDEQLTPVTRLEKILAGEDVTPVTRLEKFLQMAGGGSLEMEEGSYTPDSSTQTFSVTFSNTHSARPSVFCLFLDNDEESPTFPGSNSMLREYYINLDKVSVDTLTEKLYGIAALSYIDTKTSATSVAYKITKANDDTGTTQNYMPGYWCSKTGITARNYTGCSYRRMKYSWIAIWL